MAWILLLCTSKKLRLNHSKSLCFIHMLLLERFPAASFGPSSLSTLSGGPSPRVLESDFASGMTLLPIFTVHMKLKPTSTVRAQTCTQSSYFFCMIWMPCPCLRYNISLLALGSQLVSLENNSHHEEKGYDILHSKLETLQQGVFPTQNIVWDVVQGIRYDYVLHIYIYIYIK